MNQLTDTQQAGDTCTICGSGVVLVDLGADGVELVCECACSEALV
jgi:hypothetical protein